MESLLSHQYFKTDNQTEMYSDVFTAILPTINNINLTEPVNFTIQHKKVQCQTKSNDYTPSIQFLKYQISVYLDFAESTSIWNSYLCVLGKQKQEQQRGTRRCRRKRGRDDALVNRRLLGCILWWKLHSVQLLSPLYLCPHHADWGGIKDFYVHCKSVLLRSGSQ